MAVHGWHPKCQVEGSRKALVKRLFAAPSGVHTHYPRRPDDFASGQIHDSVFKRARCPARIRRLPGHHPAALWISESHGIKHRGTLCLIAKQRITVCPFVAACSQPQPSALTRQNRGSPARAITVRICRDFFAGCRNESEFQHAHGH